MLDIRISIYTLSVLYIFVCYVYYEHSCVSRFLINAQKIADYTTITKEDYYFVSLSVKY